MYFWFCLYGPRSLGLGDIDGLLGPTCRAYKSLTTGKPHRGSEPAQEKWSKLCLKQIFDVMTSQCLVIVS